MTLQREAWIDDRPVAVIRDRHTEDGEPEPEVFVCLKCNKETPADPDVFRSHLCHKTTTKKRG